MQRTAYFSAATSLRFPLPIQCRVQVASFRDVGRTGQSSIPVKRRRTTTSAFTMLEATPSKLCLQMSTACIILAGHNNFVEKTR